MVKRCTRCNTVQSASEFYRAPANRDGLMGACKTCKKASVAKSRARRGPETVREAARDYRSRNRDKFRQWDRSWRESNKSKKAEWKRINPDAVSRHRSKDRARRYGADHEPYNRSEVFERWCSRCCYCDATATTLDHVAPLGFGGHDVERNVVPACHPCNSSKGRKTLAEWVASWRP